MNLKLFSIGVVMLWISIVTNVTKSENVSINLVANRSVDALQHQRYRDAAAMFVQSSAEGISITERTLKRIDDSLGGFSTLHPVSTLPDGKSVRLDVATQ